MSIPVEHVLSRVIPVTKSGLKVAVPLRWWLCGRQRRCSWEGCRYIWTVEAPRGVGRGSVPATSKALALPLGDPIETAVSSIDWLHTAAGAWVEETPRNIGNDIVPTATLISALRLGYAYVATVNTLDRLDRGAEADTVAVRKQEVVNSYVTSVACSSYTWKKSRW